VTAAQLTELRGPPRQGGRAVFPRLRTERRARCGLRSGGALSPREV